MGLPLKTAGLPAPSLGHTLRPSSPPLASRPSGSTARDRTELPCERTTGSPAPSFGHSLILPLLPPLAAARPAAPPGTGPGCPAKGPLARLHHPSATA